jgi:hypothetical protein
MDYSTKSRDELLALCKEKGVKGYSSKKKADLILSLSEPIKPVEQVKPAVKVMEPVETDRPFRMIDLFAGTGAFSRAFEQTGKVSCVFANDMVVPSKEIYDCNFHHPLTLGDLNDIPIDTFPRHDILTG